MEINTIQYEFCDLVRPNGRIDSFTAPKLAETMNMLTVQGRHKIVLDLVDVNYVSSAGLRVLIDVQKSCKQLGRGELILVNVPARVFETLELAGFVPLFKVFDSLDKALEYFSFSL
jgi:anti-sigma B factor antagonist